MSEVHHLDLQTVRNVLAEVGLETSSVGNAGYGTRVTFKLSTTYLSEYRRRSPRGGSSTKPCKHGYEQLYLRLRDHIKHLGGRGEPDLFDATTYQGQRNEVEAVHEASCSCEPTKSAVPDIDTEPISIEDIQSWRVVQFKYPEGIVGRFGGRWQGAFLKATCDKPRSRSGNSSPHRRRRYEGFPTKFWESDVSTKSDLPPDPGDNEKHLRCQQHLMYGPTECGCGIYSIKGLPGIGEINVDGGAAVFTKVQLSGVVVENTHGYRSSQAEMKEIYLVRRDETFPISDVKVAELVEAMYGAATNLVTYNQLSRKVEIGGSSI